MDLGVLGGGHRSVSSLEEGELCCLAEERGLGHGEAINSVFLQPRGRDSQLELPAALELCLSLDF